MAKIKTSKTNKKNPKPEQIKTNRKTSAFGLHSNCDMEVLASGLGFFSILKKLGPSAS
jgi:hypothetical protein